MALILFTDKAIELAAKLNAGEAGEPHVDELGSEGRWFYMVVINGITNTAKIMVKDETGKELGYLGDEKNAGPI